MFADEDQARVADVVRIADGGDRNAVLRGDAAQRLPLYDHVDSRWGDRCARRRGGRGRRGGRPRRIGTPRAGRRRGRGSRGWSSGRRRPARCGTATGVSDPVGDRRGCQIRHGGETRERNQDRDGAYREPRSPGRSGPWSTGIAGLAEGARSGGTARRAGSSARCPRAPRDDRRGHGRRRGCRPGATAGRYRSQWGNVAARQNAAWCPRSIGRGLLAA